MPPVPVDEYSIIPNRNFPPLPPFPKVKVCRGSGGARLDKTPTGLGLDHSQEQGQMNGYSLSSMIGSIPKKSFNTDSAVQKAPSTQA